MDLGEIERDDMDWIDLAQDMDQWRTFVRTVMNLDNKSFTVFLLVLVLVPNL
jgi:hypothetical protein